MIITGNDTEEISQLQKKLATKFEMKDLGRLKYFRETEILGHNKVHFSQLKYILNLLSEVGMLECKLAEFPIIQSHKLCKYPDQILTDKGKYQRLVGKLIYLSHTHPDISYVMSVAHVRIIWML